MRRDFVRKTNIIIKIVAASIPCPRAYHMWQCTHHEHYQFEKVYYRQEILKHWHSRSVTNSSCWKRKTILDRNIKIAQKKENYLAGKIT